MPLVWTLLLTLAALGLVFVVVLTACAIDGFRTWHRWRNFARHVRDLESTLGLLVSAARKKGEQSEAQMREHVARIHELPILPCERHDCPRRSGRC